MTDSASRLRLATNDKLRLKISRLQTEVFPSSHVCTCAAVTSIGLYWYCSSLTDILARLRSHVRIYRVRRMKLCDGRATKEETKAGHRG